MLTLLLTLLAIHKSYAATSDYYTAAVVELATPTYHNISADQVMLFTAAIFADYMKNASVYGVDIIVFPEGGLHGQNPARSIALPSPDENANPCNESNKYHQALVYLSCAAKSYNMYLVVNTGEMFCNSSSNKTDYYNSNVVFDRNGTVVGRYRKFNPYGEPVTKPTLDLHTFTTDFNVTFGMFTCFDINFLEPGVVLANDRGVKHFVFPHCWVSELPFLTAIQAQWGFAYSLDTVLLASGCNRPAWGGTGSGIYHGKQGALKYFQTNSHSSKLIIANVSKSFSYQSEIRSSEGKADTTFTYKEPSRNVPSDELLTVRLLEEENTNSSLFLLRDYTDVYKSQLLFPSGSSASFVPASSLKNSSLDVTLTTESKICQGTLCCFFKVKVTSSFSPTQVNSTSRGDDFTRQFYRLAAFDGVRWYGGGIATGGVQICGVIPCVNESISSCGLRSDDPSAEVATFGPLFKVGTVFESVSITGVFGYNKTFLYPDILTTGTDDNFGALVSSDIFTYRVLPPYNGSIEASLKIYYPVSNLVSAAIYARQCDRDGQKRTDFPAVNVAHPMPQDMLGVGVLFLFFFNCIFSWIN